MIHSFVNNYSVISADQCRFHQTDKHRIKNWETQAKCMFLSFTQSEFLSFKLSVHQSNKKSFCLHQSYSNHSSKSAWDFLLRIPLFFKNLSEKYLEWKVVLGERISYRQALHYCIFLVKLAQHYCHFWNILFRNYICCITMVSFELFCSEIVVLGEWWCHKNN